MIQPHGSILLLTDNHELQDKFDKKLHTWCMRDIRLTTLSSFRSYNELLKTHGKKIEMIFVSTDLPGGVIEVKKILTLSYRNNIRTVVIMRNQSEEFKNWCAQFSVQIIRQDGDEFISIYNLLNPLQAFIYETRFTPIFTECLNTHNKQLRHKIRNFAIPRYPNSPVLIEGPAKIGKKHLAKFLHLLNRPDQSQQVFLQYPLAESLEETLFNKLHRSNSNLYVYLNRGEVVLENSFAIPLADMEFIESFVQKGSYTYNNKRYLLNFRFAFMNNPSSGPFPTRLRHLLSDDITLPPLNQRSEDVGLFLQEYTRKFKNHIKVNKQGIKSVLKVYPIKNNFEDLMNFIHWSKEEKQDINARSLMHYLDKINSVGCMNKDLSKVLQIGLDAYLNSKTKEVLEAYKQLFPFADIKQMVSDIGISRAKYYRYFRE